MASIHALERLIVDYETLIITLVISHTYSGRYDSDPSLTRKGAKSLVEIKGAEYMANFQPPT